MEYCITSLYIDVTSQFILMSCPRKSTQN